jgi:hypothetical protein
MFCPKSTKLKMLHKYTSKVGRRFHNSDSEPAIRTPQLKPKANWKPDRQMSTNGQQDCFRYFQSRSTQEEKDTLRKRIGMGGGGSQVELKWWVIKDNLS